MDDQALLYLIPNPDLLKIKGDKHLISIKGEADLEKEFYNFALNFKKSAHIITTHLFDPSSNIGKLDTYFFSVAYLYRHSLELILKAIGFKYIQAKQDRQAFIKDTFHNLQNLLASISGHIESQIRINRGAYDWLTSLFTDISEIDKGSDSFRYPFVITIDRNPFVENDPFSEVPKQYGIRPIFSKQTHINLATFASKMEIAFDILSRYYSDSLTISDNYQKYSPTFLEEGGSYYGQSVVGYSYKKNRFSPYVSAYTETAGYLFGYINTNNRAKESLFFPMCYLYRNGIELALKEILFEGSSYSKQDALKLIMKKKHSILGLWDKIKLDIQRHSGSNDDSYLIYAEEYINQLHKFDGAADKFRYPTNKHLELHFKNTKKIDIENASGFFEQLAKFLHGVCLMMSHQNEMMAEIESEYGRYTD